MRVLLSVVGTRGDVQPVLALALALRELGHEARLCLPPNFVEWAQELGFAATPVGIEMRAPRGAAANNLTPSQPPIDLITDQFLSIAPAARDCDIILGANAHQYAARSVAELYDIPYVNALYAPTALPDDDSTRVWNERSLERVNANRARLGLPRIDDVLRHIVTDRPWLAADPTLAPAPSIAGMSIFQTGPWVLADIATLPRDVDAFLQAGDPPIYFGFGSMPAAGRTSHALIGAARAVGRRAILSRGWADLDLIDREPDCIAIGDVDHRALFPRVAAVVHHGGAGTTLAAAGAGVPQVVVPMFSDQPFWASRVRDLGLGTSIPFAELTSETLAAALHAAGSAAIAEQAALITTRIVLDGAAVAARRLSDDVFRLLA
jgi:vancomycin aglycone glucosyltransferase